MKPFIPHLLASFFFLALLFGKFDSESGFSELSGFGEDYQRPKIHAAAGLEIYHKPNSTGYDGQFYAQIAIDPSLRDPGFSEAIDHPSYRARRILQPAIAWTLGLGQATAVLQTHSLLNVLCLGLCGWLLLTWLPPGSWENFARWFLCVFSMGALESVRYSLADLPALTLALATIALLEKGRGKLAIVANTLSALSKETSLINAALFLSPGKTNDKPFAKRLALACIAGLIALASFAAWMAYVSSLFPPTLNTSENIGLPFRGLYRGVIGSLTELSQNGFSDRYFFRLLALLGLIFQFAYLLAKPQPRSRIWALGIIYGILFITLGDAVWRGYWAGCRITLPMTVAFNILYTPKNKTALWCGLILTNLVFTHALIRWM